MEQENKIRLEQIEDVTIFDIRGDVTDRSKSRLHEAYAHAARQNAVKILLQFETNAYINSVGIGVLIELLSKTKKNRQQVGIIGLSDHFKKIFNMVGIAKIASIYNTREDALKGMSERNQ